MAGEIHATEIATLIELEGSGVRATEVAVLVEMGALGVYSTSMAVLVEMELSALEYYAVGDGHNIPASFLTRLDPQPAGGYVKITRRSHSDNGKLLDEALFTEMEYSALGSAADYQDVLTGWGVLSAIENEVTIMARDAAMRWKRYNGTVVRPEMGKDVQWSSFFVRNVKILIKDLVLAE